MLIEFILTTHLPLHQLRMQKYYIGGGDIMNKYEKPMLKPVELPVALGPHILV